MKNRIFICVLLFGFQVCAGQELPGQLKKPLLLKKGQDLHIPYDTCYLISSKHYLLYEQSRKYTNSRLPSAYKDLISSYETELNEARLREDSIHRSYKELNERYSNTLKGMEKNLGILSENLRESRSRLDQAGQQIRESTEIQKKNRKKSLYHTILVGLGGFGAGIFITSIIK